MDDLQYGKRNKRGDWSPNARLEIAPFYRLPISPLAILKWLPGYFLPWNLLFAASAVLYWQFVVPDVEVMKTIAWGWVLRLFAVNCVAVFLFYGAFEYRLYVSRAQANRFKYNARFPADQKNSAFLFNNQNVDGMIRGFGTGVPIWTAYEVGVLWAFANGCVPWLSFAEHPVHLFLLALVVPILHEFHFFCIHRLIHWGPLYKWVHSVHHNSVNPSPWSSLSMHPVEHLLYFSTILWHVVIPSNPVLALYQLHFAGFGAIPGHVGFDKMEVTDTMAVDSHAYGHYLHHKYFEVNYGDGLVPLDKLFGTWHDGSPEGEARMNKRFQKRRARANAAAKAGTPAE
jgi:sterol desaturase/sphingolipid hydroxylase (fatty acid hydroxylase superfamily)